MLRGIGEGGGEGRHIDSAARARAGSARLGPNETDPLSMLRGSVASSPQVDQEVQDTILRPRPKTQRLKDAFGKHDLYGDAAAPGVMGAAEEEQTVGDPPAMSPKKKAGCGCFG